MSRRIFSDYNKPEKPTERCLIRIPCLPEKMQREGNHHRHPAIRKIPTIISQNSATSSKQTANSLDIQPVQVLREEICMNRSNDSIQSRNSVSSARSSIRIANEYEFGPSLLLANTKYLAPKIDEVRCFIQEQKLDLISLTETWLRDTINHEYLLVPEYSLICKNRVFGLHGGVCLYIKNTIPYNRLVQLEKSDIEVLWVHIRPTRLPRGIPCIITGTVYHPPSADDGVMLEYLSTTLTTIESLYPGCGILLTGDFNRLNIRRLLVQFKMKQLVRAPTRGDHTLDLIITNMPQAYNSDSVQCIPSFGLSDHNGVLLRTKARLSNKNISRRTMTKRDTQPSRKAELGRYLNSIGWSVLDDIEGCENKLQLLMDFIKNGFDTIMSLKQAKLHVNDPPWITADFKKLLKSHQQAFSNGDRESYHHLRNLVNRERKSLRGRYFSSKIQHLKETKPNQWWSAVKRIVGMVPACGSEALQSQLHIDGIDSLSPQDIANLINDAFLEPMQCYQMLDSLLPSKRNLRYSKFLSMLSFLSCVNLPINHLGQMASPTGFSKNMLKSSPVLSAAF